MATHHRNWNSLEFGNKVNVNTNPGDPCCEENIMYRALSLKWISKLLISYGKHAVLTVDDPLTFRSNNINNINNINNLNNGIPIGEKSAVSTTIRDYYKDYGKLKSKNKACLMTRPSMNDKIPNVLIKHEKHTKRKFKCMAELGNYKPLEFVYPTGISSQFWYQLLNLPSILFNIENLITFYDLQTKLKECNNNNNNNNNNNHIDSNNNNNNNSNCGIYIEFGLICQALSNLSSGMGTSNKDLEWIGDAVLDICVLLRLLMQHTNDTRKQWDNKHKSMTSNETLSQYGNCNGNHSLDENETKTEQKANAKSDKLTTKLNLAQYGVFKEFSWQLWHPAFFWPRIESLHLNQNVGKKAIAGNIESLIA